MNIVIVGGGLAAAKATEELRERGHDGPITVLAGEDHLPYERPPLSKGILLGKDDADAATVLPRSWYDEHGVTLRTSSAVDSIDLEAGVVLVGEESIEFDRLLLATGSRPRHLALADDSGASVAYLRTLEDSAAIKASSGRGDGW